MIDHRISPGQIRDAIVDYLQTRLAEASVSEIQEAVDRRLGSVVPRSSVRSYLSLNARTLFDRTDVGTYRLRDNGTGAADAPQTDELSRAFKFGRCRLYQADCLDWLRSRNPHSIEAVVTDPPYGLVEYSVKEQEKLRAGKGGVWRIPPSFDGHQRAPLPRFTTLTEGDLDALVVFFGKWARTLMPVLVPGAHVIVATNPLLSYLVAGALAGAGFERRGEVIRLVMTMRGRRPAQERPPGIPRRECHASVDVRALAGVSQARRRAGAGQP